MTMQMMDIRDRLSTNLARAMQIQADNLSAGRAGTFDQYQRAVGNIKGLKDALDITDQVFSKLVDSEENEA